MFLVGDVQIVGPVFLAPMAGVTDAPFRSEAAHFGAPAVVTEMVVGSELASDAAEFVRRAQPHRGMGPFIVQLAGREPQSMTEAARIVEQAGADIIDINMGCPSKRVTGGQSGCALMREPRLAGQLVAAVVAGSTRPVTVKMRLGWDHDNLNASEIARIAEAEGAAMVTVHGRTRTQFYDGVADWERIADVVDAVGIPVVANGDITNLDQAREAMSVSGATGVMIGRGSTGRPWKPAEIAAGLSGARWAQPDVRTRLVSIRRQVEKSATIYGERAGVRIVRKHLAAFTVALGEDFPHDFPPSTLTVLRTRLCSLDDVSDVLRELDRLTLESVAEAA